MDASWGRMLAVVKPAAAKRSAYSKRITAAQRQEIMALYVSNTLTYQQIADRVGCKRAFVALMVYRKRWRYLRLKRTPKPRLARWHRLDAGLRARILEDVRAGLKYVDIGARHGVGTEMVSALAIDHGLRRHRERKPRDAFRSSQA